MNINDDQIAIEYKYRYCPIFKGDEGSTLLGMMEGNGLSLDRKSATSKRDKLGNKPTGLLKLKIIDLKWVKKNKETKK
jgi:hypothetical protein